MKAPRDRPEDAKMGCEIRTEVEGRHHHRQLRVGDEAVSRLMVWDLEMWLLGERVRVGGIGGVHTDREHRNKGYMRRLMQDTVEYMTGLEQHFSMLFGISDFYNKFGFLPCLPEHRAEMATRDAERAAEEALPGRFRPMEDGDHAFVVALYNEENRLRPAAIVRDEEHFHGFPKGSGWRTKAVPTILEDEAGRVLGYMVCDEGRTDVTVVELNARDDGHFASMLAELARLAVERRCGQIEFRMPPDHAFMRFARRFGLHAQADYPRMGGGMMRVLNQEPAFEVLRAAMERRFAETGLGDESVALTIETDLGESALRFGDGEGGTVRGAVRLDQGRLAQVMVGYRAARDVLSDPGVENEGEAERLLETLFGGRLPYVWQSDRF
jgi:predicted acetyltransferase